MITFSRKVREDVEQEWFGRMSLLEEKYETKLSYVEELERALEREKQVSNASSSLNDQVI